MEAEAKAWAEADAADQASGREEASLEWYVKKIYQEVDKGLEVCQKSLNKRGLGERESDYLRGMIDVYAKIGGFRERWDYIQRRKVNVEQDAHGPFSASEVI